MKQEEFINKWRKERPLFEKWGKFIKNEIFSLLGAANKDVERYLKVSAEPRLKSEASMLDKAFFRGKEYSEPYDQIEDKVGIRFVVLLLEDIEFISKQINRSPYWLAEVSRDFKDEKGKAPLLFTYQSIHYILRPTSRNEEFPPFLTCEVQIRTLLQHAHAELTHDAIYKANKTIQPEVQRTVAKSMALIETTDNFFTEVTTLLNRGPLDEFNFERDLDNLYYEVVDIKARPCK